MFYLRFDDLLFTIYLLFSNLAIYSLSPLFSERRKPIPLGEDLGEAGGVGAEASLYERQDYFAQHFVVEEVLTLKELHLLPSVVLEEVGLTVDEVVLRAEESPHERFFLRVDALEALFLHLLELLNHLLIDLELSSAVLPFVAELASAQASERQQPCHVEGGIDENPLEAPELLGVHRAHAGGHNEVGLLLLHEGFQEGYGLQRAYRHVGTQHLHSLGIEMVAHLRGRACAACRGKAVDVNYLFHAAKVRRKFKKEERTAKKVVLFIVVR